MRTRVIVIDGAKAFKGRTDYDKTELQRFILDHRFYEPSIPLPTLLYQLQECLKKNNTQRSRSQPPRQQQEKQESLHQLALYLNKDNNKQIFSLFEQILNHPRGISYDSLSKKLKTDIITVSHYCCKLKKLRLIDWEHEKEGVRVFPRTQRKKDESPRSFTHPRNEVSFDLKESLLFSELTMNENIWINISSEESMSRGGMTNEEVKRKIMKHAENKMVRRTVESMKYFDRNAERQGKVFEFKYKNETQEIKDEMMKRKQEHGEIDGEIEKLDGSILDWLRHHFPQFGGQTFLLELINNKFKDYLSILGVKQSKRQCTPLKLNRYIRVLNYLNSEGGMRESELRALIVKDQAQFNVGIMHKRSLMGILQGLKGLQIIVEDEGIYYPGWVKEESWRRQQPVRRMKQEYHESPLPRKKVHVDPTIKLINKKEKVVSQTKANQNKKQPNGHQKISERKYKWQLFTAVLTIALQKTVKKILRKGFNRIVYVERKKVLQQYTPQLHVLNVLEGAEEAPEINFDCGLEVFYGDLDLLVQERGEKEREIPQMQNQVVKFIRKNPSKGCSFLRIKYGKNWRSKFTLLQQMGLLSIEQQGLRLCAEDRLLV